MRNRKAPAKQQDPKAADKPVDEPAKPLSKMKRSELEAEFRKLQERLNRKEGGKYLQPLLYGFAFFSAAHCIFLHTRPQDMPVRLPPVYLAVEQAFTLSRTASLVISMRATCQEQAAHRDQFYA